MAESHTMRIKVTSIGETKEFGASGFKKRELVGVEEGQYPQTVMFEFVQDKVDLLDGLIEDTYVTVHYNIRCREFIKEGQETRYFVSLSGWRVVV